MRFLILNADYPDFLASLYSQNPGLENRSFEEQMAVRNLSLFGDGGFYSGNLRKAGHDARDIYINNAHMQSQWAREHGVEARARTWEFRLRKGIVPWISRVPPNDLDRILRAQIEQFRPDILLNHAVNMVSTGLLRQIRSSARLVVAQIASPLRRMEDLAAYDVVVTSSPHLFQIYKQMGLAVEFVRLGFEPAILEKLQPRQPEIAASFIGSFFPDHKTRTDLLEHLCRRCDLSVWGNGVERLPADSPIRSRYVGTAWGIDMYNILRRSKITVNHHTDIAGRYASNMRLYEATGAGTMLLTDWKENLEELFRVGREVIAFRTPEECEELLRYYCTHDAEREAVASAGQQRTLREHTYYDRMNDLTRVLVRHLK